MYKRLSHSATQVGSYLFIVGGHNGAEYSSEVILLNLGVSVHSFGISLVLIMLHSLVALRAAHDLWQTSKREREPCDCSSRRKGVLIWGF